MSGIIIAGKCDIEDLLTVNNSIVLDSDNFTSGTSLTFKNDSVSPRQLTMALKSSRFEIKDNNDIDVLYFDHSNSSDYIYINRPLQLSGGSSYVNYNALGSDYVQGVVRVTGQDVRVESSTANMLVYCDSNHDIKSTGITPTQLSAMNTISSNAVVKNPTAPQTIVGQQLKLDDGAMTIVRGLSTNFALNTYATGDAQSRMVATAGGLLSFGDGTNAADVSFGRRGVGIIGTGYKFEAGQGLRATGYDGTNLTGQGVEMHLAAGVGRFLSYNRDTGTRLPLRLDGKELQFYTNNGTNQATLTSAGLFSLNNLSTNAVVVTDASKNLVSSSITTTELDHLYNVSSNIQDQLNSKATSASLTAYQPLDNDLTEIAALSTHNFGRSLLIQSAAPDTREYIKASGAVRIIASDSASLVSPPAQWFFIPGVSNVANAESITIDLACEYPPQTIAWQLKTGSTVLGSFSNTGGGSFWFRGTYSAYSSIGIIVSGILIEGTTITHINWTALASPSDGLRLVSGTGTGTGTIHLTAVKHVGE